MANANIETNTHTQIYTLGGMYGPYWSSQSRGAIVFINSNIDVAIRFTTDGGATWSNQVVVFTGTIVALGCFFDKEVPNDTGNLIYMAYSDGDSDDFFFRTYNVATNTLGTQSTVALTVSDLGTVLTNDITVGKSRSGYLYIGYTSNLLRGFHRSTDGGATWSAGLAELYEAIYDISFLFPANTSDDNDMAAVYYDDSAARLSIKMWDNSAGTWTESFSLSHFTISGERNCDAALRWSDGNIILVYHNNVDTTGDDIVTQDITVNSIASPTLVTRAQVKTNRAESAVVSITIDQSTNYLYVAYLYGPTWLSSVSCYNRRSTDGAVSWETELELNSGANADLRYITSGRTVTSASGGRVKFAWWNNPLRDIIHNSTHDVIIYGPPTPISLAGSQPAATGIIESLIIPGEIALSGIQPDPSGLLNAQQQLLNAIDGIQPASSGVLTQQQLSVINTTGVQPASSGVLESIIQLLAISLEGNQLSASSLLTFLQVLAISIDGIQPSSSSSLSSIYSINLSGIQPTATGTLTAQQSLNDSLTGNEPAATGLISVQYNIAIVGIQPAPVSTLTAIQSLFINILGSQPTATGIVTLLIYIIGSQNPASSILNVLQQLAVLLEGVQPESTGFLNKTYPANLTGEQPASTGNETELSGRVLSGIQNTPSATLNTNYLISVTGNQNLPAGIGKELIYDAIISAIAGIRTTTIALTGETTTGILLDGKTLKTTLIDGEATQDTTLNSIASKTTTLTRG